MAVVFASGSAKNKGKKKGVKTTSKVKTPSGKVTTKPSVAYAVVSGEAVATWGDNGLKHVKEYLVWWKYKTATTSAKAGQWLWATTSAQSVGTNVQATFSVPEGATAVQVAVKPVSKQHTYKWQSKEKKKYTSGANKGKYYYQWTQHEKQVDYWTGSFTYSAETSTGASVVPQAPSVSSLTADGAGRVTFGLSSASGTDLRVEVRRYQDGGWASHGGGTLVGTYDSGERTVSNAFTAQAGHSYRIDARQVNTTTGASSDWSSFSDVLEMPPLAPSGLSVASTGPTSFLATWAKAAYSGDGFELRWGPDRDTLLLDELPDGAQSATTAGATSYSAQVSAGIWYFAVRATGEGSSPWSAIATLVGGMTPQKPTISELPKYARHGDLLPVSWTYNNPDGSAQEGWEAEWRAAGGDWTELGSGSTSASSTNLDTLLVEAGQDVSVRVRTRNAIGWSPWTESTAVTVETAPDVTVSAPPTAESFPVRLEIASTSTVRLWHLLVTSTTSKSVIGPDGNDEVMPAGSVAFEGLLSVENEGFDGDEIEVDLDLSQAALYSGVTYVATVEGVTPHGLSGTGTATFLVSVSGGDAPSPIAAIPPVDDDLEAHIFPSCEGEDGELRQDVTLSVYRIDSDGEPLLVAADVPNDGTVEVIDPHPSFGECWYRIAARAENGSVGFYDAMVEVDCDSVVIQFEDGVNGYSTDFDAGAIIELPYDIDLTETYEGDVALASFIGNSDPTLYTGTQLGRTARASSTVHKTDDPEVISRVRRLAGSLSRAYYRDPSGLGFWAWVRPTIRHQGSQFAEASFEVTRIMGDYSGRK